MDNPQLRYQSPSLLYGKKRRERNSVPKRRSGETRAVVIRARVQSIALQYKQSTINYTFAERWTEGVQRGRMKSGKINDKLPSIAIDRAAGHPARLF